MLDEFVKLMSEFRFANVDFAVVKDHIDTIANLTVDELKVAVKRNENVATPCLDNVLPYLSGANGCEESFTWANACYGPNQRRRSTIMGQSLIAVDKKIEMDTVELRHFFLGILKSAYGKMVEHGELDGRDTFVTLVLLDGLAIAATDVDNGKPLQDWEATERLMRKELDHAVRLIFSKRGHPFRKTERTDTIAYQKLRMNVLRALAFIHAHRLALEYFEENIVGSWSSGQFQEAERVVVGEVKGQMKLARKVIENADEEDIEVLESHAFCAILLNRTALYVESLLSSGILLEKEANVILDEIEEKLEATRHCAKHVHAGHLSKHQKSEHMAYVDSHNSSKDKDDGSSIRNSSGDKEEGISAYNTASDDKDVGNSSPKAEPDGEDDGK